MSGRQLEIPTFSFNVALHHRENGLYTSRFNAFAPSRVTEHQEYCHAPVQIILPVWTMAPGKYETQSAVNLYFSYYTMTDHMGVGNTCKKIITLSLATDVTDATLGASGLLLGTRAGAGGTATLTKSFLVAAHGSMDSRYLSINARNFSW